MVRCKGPTELLRMQTLSLFLFVALATCAVSRCQTTSQGAEDVARQFCSMDSDAVRLDGRNSRPLWNLTTGAGEPPTGPIYVVSGFRISQPRPTGSEVTVQVHYNVLASVSEDSFLVQQFKGSQTATLHLIQTDSGWRIDVSLLHLPPHVSPGALARYYEGLLADTPAPDKLRQRRLLRTIEQLKRISKSLRTTS